MAQPVFRAISAVFSVPSAGNGSVNVDAPAGLVDGDYVFLLMLVPPSSTVATASPAAAGAAWTLLGFENNGTFSGGYRLYGKVAASEPSTYAVTETAASQQGNAITFAYSTVGATPVNGFVASGGQASSTTPFMPAVSSLAASVAGKLVGIVFEWNNRAVTITPAGTMTPRLTRSTAVSCVIADENVAAGTVAQRTGSASSGDYRGISIVLAGTDAVGSGELSGSATLDGLSATGALSNGAASGITGTAALDGLSASGALGAALGTLTSSELKLNNSTAHTSAPFEAFVSDKTTGVQIVRKTGLTSSSSPTAPVCTFVDAALPVPGTQVRVTWRRTDTGAEGTELLNVS